MLPAKHLAQCLHGQSKGKLRQYVVPYERVPSFSPAVKKKEVFIEHPAVNVELFPFTGTSAGLGLVSVRKDGCW